MNLSKCFCLIIALILVTVNALPTPEDGTNNDMPTTTTTTKPGGWYANRHRNPGGHHQITAPYRRCPGEQKLDAQGVCRDPL